MRRLNNKRHAVYAKLNVYNLSRYNIHRKKPIIFYLASSFWRENPGSKWVRDPLAVTQLVWLNGWIDFLVPDLMLTRADNKIVL